MRRFLLLLLIVYVCSCCEFQRQSPSKPRSLLGLSQLLSSEEGTEEVYKEFEEIKSGKRRPWTVGELPENIEKNRYKDLLAFDHSRVVLRPLPDDPHSDYINANFIDGQNSCHEYIATQGPLPNTIYDFWRMILQNNVSKIVALASLVEKGETKVEKYWPETSESYRAIEVKIISETSIPRLQHVIRTFSVKQVGNDKVHNVRQFHFTGWPDLGVPSDRLPVISIIREARRYDPENEAPIVVHCSAGVGRTGTLILMDSMIQQALTEGVVDFPKRLDYMRQQRPDMVEKKEQYLFAYEAVNDVLNVNGTMRKLEEIDKEYQNLDNYRRIRRIRRDSHSTHVI